MLKKGLIVLCILSSSYIHLANDAESNRYFFTNSNVIVNDASLQAFYQKLDSLLAKNSGKINIVHIGDSHIQADYFSGELRKKLQNTFGNGGRGFVFPYQIAKSNGPSDVGVGFKGNWTFNTIMKGYEYANIGASGYTVYAQDSSLLTIFPDRNDFLNYSFNKITLFQSNGFFEPQNTKHDVRASAIGGSDLLPFSTYVLRNYLDSITLMAKNADGNSVEFHGAVFENSEPGIIYHAMGTNGASTVQYLRSNKFDKQVAALKADLVIISFGTNDCYIPYSRFCSSCAKDRFRTIIYKLRKLNPDVAILITTPADHFYRRRYDNRNLWYLNKALFKLSSEENVALWDLYGIMGGERSIINWQRGGYARGDLIHFTKQGYTLQAELLYEALINSYESRFN